MNVNHFSHCWFLIFKGFIVSRFGILFLGIVCLGCGAAEKAVPTTATNVAATPSFTLAWSEYPSWSVFGVASEKGLINGAAGKLGPIEKKWGVDLVLKEADYDTCLTMYGANSVDAVCMTNIDSLAPSLTRKSVGILPTSTSVGADACIIVSTPEGSKPRPDIQPKPSDHPFLANHADILLSTNATYGLQNSVSQYVFERVIEKETGKKPNYEFKNMDPAAAAQAMQTKQNGINSIMVWNPFVLQTLRTRTDAFVAFDSSSIPEEVVDMVVVGQDSLDKPKGKEFALAVIDTYYKVNDLLADAKQGDETLVSLGSKFSNLGLEDMKLVVQQTRFYNNADAAKKILTSEKFQKETMPKVVDFCLAHGIVASKPSVGFNDTKAQFNITDQYVNEFVK